MCVYEFIYGCESLASEQLDVLYSYSLYKNISHLSVKVKKKVKSLHYTMNIYVEVDVETCVFLTSVPIGGELSASCALRKSPRYLLDRRLVGLHSWSGRCGEVRILGLTRIQTPTLRSSSQ